ALYAASCCPCTQRFRNHPPLLTPLRQKRRICRRKNFNLPRRTPPTNRQAHRSSVYHHRAARGSAFFPPPVDSSAPCSSQCVRVAPFDPQVDEECAHERGVREGRAWAQKTQQPRASTAGAEVAAASPGDRFPPTSFNATTVEWTVVTTDERERPWA
ncbi:unnamed protein product, partial [Scytosiphon promiscuus]